MQSQIGKNGNAFLICGDKSESMCISFPCERRHSTEMEMNSTKNEKSIDEAKKKKKTNVFL